MIFGILERIQARNHIKMLFAGLDPATQIGRGGPHRLWDPIPTRLYVLTVMNVNMIVFWNVTPCTMADSYEISEKSTASTFTDPPKSWNCPCF
jgi:hypothetical protein